MQPRNPLGRLAWAGGLILLGLLLILLGLFLSVPWQGRAQAAISVLEDKATLIFPDFIEFDLKAASTAKIEKVSLLYGSDSRACQASANRQTFEVKPSSTILESWRWDFTRTGVLPPGTQAWWQWEIQDSTGARLLTEKRTLRVEDGRHTWKQITQEKLHLLWYEGRQSFGKSLMSLAVKALGRLEERLGMRPSEEIWITIYPTPQEIRQTLIFVPEWTGGVAFPEYDALIIAIPPGEEAWAADVIPHELSHLVVGLRVFNCRGGTLPTWLEEGLAVYAEGQEAPPDPVLEALRNDNLPPLASLAEGFSAFSQKASLSYQQSGMVVTYLIETHGQAKMDELLAAVQSGQVIDQALKSVYGFDTSGLDAAWRRSLGFEPAASPTHGSQESASTATPIPTVALWTPTLRLTASLPPSPTAPTPTLAPSPASSSTPLPKAGPPARKAAPACCTGLLPAALLAVLFITRRPAGDPTRLAAVITPKGLGAGSGPRKTSETHIIKGGPPCNA